MNKNKGCFRARHCVPLCLKWIHVRVDQDEARGCPTPSSLFSALARFLPRRVACFAARYRSGTCTGSRVASSARSGRMAVDPQAVNAAQLRLFGVSSRLGAMLSPPRTLFNSASGNCSGRGDKDVGRFKERCTCFTKSWRQQPSISEEENRGGYAASEQFTLSNCSQTGSCLAICRSPSSNNVFPAALLHA